MNIRSSININRIKPAGTLILWGIAAGFTALYISLIFNNNIWTDEGFTMQLLNSGGLKAITEGTAADVHPPLYYYWAKLFMNVFGPSLQVQKIAAIIPMTLLLVYGAIVIRKYFGTLTAILFDLFIACIPCSMEFAVQVRMYSMAILFVTVCGVSAFLIFTGSCTSKASGTTAVILYILCGLGAAYTHYFALVSAFLIAFVYLIACIVRALMSRSAKSLKAWFIYSAIMIIGYLPWVPSLLAQVTRVEDSYWIPPVTAEVVKKYFTWTFGLKDDVLGISGKTLGTAATIITLAILAIAILAAILSLISHSGSKCSVQEIQNNSDSNIFAILCALVPTLTCLLGIVASILPGRNPVYRDQYIFPALGLLSLSFAIGTRSFICSLSYRSSGRHSSIPSNNVPDMADSNQAFASRTETLNIAGRIYLCCVLCFLLTVGALQYRECYRQEYTSTYLDQTMQFFEKNVGENDPILYNFEVYGFIYEYYWPADRLCYFENFDFSSDFGTAWILSTPNMPMPDDSVYLMNGLGLEDMGRYGIEQNEFEIYKVTHLE